MENTDITTNNQHNTLPGWSKLEYTFTVNIDQYNLDADKIEVTLATLARWATIETKKITQNCVSIEGDAYEHTITAQVACRGNNPEHLLGDMKESGMILRLTDNNGRRYIAGCPEEPLRMNFAQKDNNNSSEGAIVELNFTCTSRNPLLPEA